MPPPHLPRLYLIAGCNGAGKTTAAFTILPEMLQCREFVNADEIARGLSPFQPATVAIEAGRIMLHRINDLLAKQVDFALETTLATRSYVALLKRAKQCGYLVTLVYFWLKTPALAIERVKARVASGGHHIPEEVIRRRYQHSVKNLFALFIPLADYWVLIDNSKIDYTIIAEGNKRENSTIFDEERYTTLKSYRDEGRTG